MNTYIIHIVTDHPDARDIVAGATQRCAEQLDDGLRESIVTALAYKDVRPWPTAGADWIDGYNLEEVT